MALRVEDAEFKTLDGLTLRGNLYPASSRGPAIIITPGVSALPTVQEFSASNDRVTLG